MRMKLHAELIFIRKVSHLDSFWNRGTRELGNGLLCASEDLNRLNYTDYEHIYDTDQQGCLLNFS